MPSTGEASSNDFIRRIWMELFFELTFHTFFLFAFYGQLTRLFFATILPYLKKNLNDQV
jgi:hypothetical protein